MELPKSGSVVIIDDKINEALPLMNALAMQGISYCYYNGEPKNYPKKPLNNIRLIFLDMHLDEVASTANGSKNIISTLMSGLSTIIDENNGPYVIMVWSKHDSQYMQDFTETVMEKDGLPSKPVAILNMEKAECFESSNNDGTVRVENEKKEWKLKSNGSEIIKQTITEQLKMVDAFIILYNWENGIRESANETVKTISSIFVNEKGQWNKNIKGIFTRMANAYAGKTLGTENTEVIKNVYYSMNEMVNDSNCVIAEQIADDISCINVLQEEEEIRGIVQMVKMINDKEYILSYDSSSYFLYENKKMKCQNGKIEKIYNYQTEDKDEIGKTIKDIYEKSIASVNALLLLRNYVLSKEHPGNIYISSDEIKTEICDEHNIPKADYEKIIGIELEISPICDYAQKKRRRLRILRV